jgi:hypothetical protein
MKKWVLAVFGMVALQAGASSVSQDTAVERALNWMSGNPVMSKASQSIGSIETFPGIGTNYSVYVVQLEPIGYLILNSDDRLPLLVSFSANSLVDMTEHPQNALRSMLISYCERMTEELSSKVRISLAMTTMAEAEDELYGPFLETTWNQNNPYNLLCPDDPAGSQYYDYRVAVGCVPTAFAQVLAFHRWPVHGSGTRTYIDDSGSITGMHSAVFSDSYDWDLMQDEYNAWDTDVEPAMEAVAELMFELGVACEANYESGGTGASPWKLAERLADYFYFESCETHASESELIAPLEADLRAGFPCTVSIPGHSIVADGLMVDAGVTTYHINYGWGGSNNGWWPADNIAGDALQSGVTSLRPQLLAFPRANSVSGEAGGSVELNWILPKRRETEADKLTILRLEQQVGNWQTDCSEITGANSGWEVISGGRSGDGWYVDKSGPATLTLNEIFVPDASAQLTFSQFARLYISVFSIEVSTNGWESSDTLYSTFDSNADQIYESSWSSHAVSLAAYAGQQLQLRFILSSGGSWSGSWPGLRVDDVVITSGDWYSWQPFAVDDVLASRRFSDTTNLWIDSISLAEAGDPDLEGQPIHYTVLTNLPEGTHMLAAVLTDTNAVEHAQGPAFILTVSGDDGDGMPSDWELQYGLDPDVDDGGLDSDGDGFNNRQEYICGTVPTNAASVWKLSMGSGSLPAFLGLDNRLYTIEYCDGLASNDWKSVATGIVGSNGLFEVNSFESVTNGCRFYRVTVQEAD